MKSTITLDELEFPLASWSVFLSRCLVFSSLEFWKSVMSIYKRATGICLANSHSFTQWLAMDKTYICIVINFCIYIHYFTLTALGSIVIQNSHIPK